MPHIEISAEKLFEFFGFPVTNTLIMSWLVAGILILMASALVRNMRIIPRTLQNIFELFMEKFLDLLEGVFGSRENAERFCPIVLTLFLFILVSNWLGIFPGVGSIGFYESHGEEKIFVPFFRSAASDLNFTLSLAVLAIVFVNIMGMRQMGVFRHLSKFFNFSNPINFFVGILELIAELARIVSFSFRLFGNIFAGEVLLVIVAFLSPFGAPIPFLMLELFVGFMQALIFAMLTAVFLSLAVSHHS